MLTVLFWKKLNIMYGGTGVKLANQRKHDWHFAIIIGFYIILQTIMIVLQFASQFFHFEATFLFDISLLLSGIYMIALIAGAAKYGRLIVKMVNGKGAVSKRNMGEDKRKMKESKKLLTLLNVVIPGGILYICGLALYIVLGLRNNVETWLPMQYFFRGIEVVLIRQFSICLSKKQAPKRKANGEQNSVTENNMSTAPSFKASPATSQSLHKINVKEKTMQQSKRTSDLPGAKKTHFIETDAEKIEQGQFV